MVPHPSTIPHHPTKCLLPHLSSQALSILLPPSAPPDPPLRTLRPPLLRLRLHHPQLHGLSENLFSHPHSPIVPQRSRGRPTAPPPPPLRHQRPSSEDCSTSSPEGDRGQSRRLSIPNPFTACAASPFQRSGGGGGGACWQSESACLPIIPTPRDRSTQTRRQFSFPRPFATSSSFLSSANLRSVFLLSTLHWNERPHTTSVYVTGSLCQHWRINRLVSFAPLRAYFLAKLSPRLLLRKQRNPCTSSLIRPNPLHLTPPFVFSFLPIFPGGAPSSYS